MAKFIFVTGGVLSGVGKGVAAASIGALLKARGNSIFVQKFDPYLNHDPGTMSPYQHGEVYVTKDGGETDLDLGHYERFIGDSFAKDSNYTSGSIYSDIFKQERDGKYMGKTVQVIPHVTNEITKKILNAVKKHNPDFMIIEIGGTVGDIESQPFIHAIANFKQKDSLFIHTTYIPYLEASKEHKTKPTQHSIQLLKSYGISPNIIILRSNKKVLKICCDKVAAAAYLDKKCVINLPNANHIYLIPPIIEKSNIIKIIESHFNMKHKNIDMSNWVKIKKLISSNDKRKITIGMVGKYVELEDAYLSIIESLKISAVYSKTIIKFKWIDSSKITSSNINIKLSKCDGIVVLPGFGIRGFEGKVLTTEYTKVNKIPILGICYGMQAMVVNQARHKGITDAISSEESSEGTPVVDLIQGTTANQSIGGTLRLGQWECKLQKNTLAHDIYQKDTIWPRHRHRYEINPKYISTIIDEDFIFSGVNPKTNLVEIVELKNHPFYFGVQYHPEFTTTIIDSNPLFDKFIKSIKELKD